METEFFLTGEIAEKLRLSKISVLRLIKTGEIPAIKVGSKYRIPVKEFEQYLSIQRKKVKNQVMAGQLNQFVKEQKKEKGAGK